MYMIHTLTFDHSDRVSTSTFRKIKIDKVLIALY